MNEASSPPFYSVEPLYGDRRAYEGFYLIPPSAIWTSAAAPAKLVRPRLVPDRFIVRIVAVRVGHIAMTCLWPCGE